MFLLSQYPPVTAPPCQPPLGKGAVLIITTNPDLSDKKQTSSAKALFSCFCRACSFINLFLKLMCFLQPIFYFSVSVFISPFSTKKVMSPSVSVLKICVPLSLRVSTTDSLGWAYMLFSPTDIAA